MKKVSILGATGYAGVELVKLIANHPQAELVHITSESYTGQRLSDVYPHLLSLCDKLLESMNDLDSILDTSDVVFVALPHGHAMEVGKKALKKGVTLIDLGADYRFDDTNVYEDWYHVKHVHKNAPRVYGLAELNRKAIKNASIIANAGCYTTTSILALAPLVKNHLIQLDSIIIDAKSGTSGAGRSPKQQTHFPDFYDNFAAYGACTHRHTPEIEQAFSHLAGQKVMLNFTPHLVPMSRGIFSTCYASLVEGVTKEEITKAYEDLYGQEYFVRLLGLGAYPSVKEVRGSNFCDIAWHVDERTHRVIVLSVTDNLMKGAAGQAIQNFNIVSGFDEKLGLPLVPMYP